MMVCVRKDLVACENEKQVAKIVFFVAITENRATFHNDDHTHVDRMNGYDIMSRPV